MISKEENPFQEICIVSTSSRQEGLFFLSKGILPVLDLFFHQFEFWICFRDQKSFAKALYFILNLCLLGFVTSLRKLLKLFNRLIYLFRFPRPLVDKYLVLSRLFAHPILENLRKLVLRDENAILHLVALLGVQRLRKQVTGNEL